MINAVCFSALIWFEFCQGCTFVYMVKRSSDEAGEKNNNLSAAICMRNEKLYLNNVINESVLSGVSCNDPLGVLK